MRQLLNANIFYAQFAVGRASFVERTMGAARFSVEINFSRHRLIEIVDEIKRG